MPCRFGSLEISSSGLERLLARLLNMAEKIKIFTKDNRYSQVQSGMRMVSMKQDVRMWLYKCERGPLEDVSNGFGSKGRVPNDSRSLRDDSCREAFWTAWQSWLRVLRRSYWVLRRQVLVLIPDGGLYCTVGLYSRQAISSTITIQRSELIAHHMEDGPECWKVEYLSVAPSISWHHISRLRRRFGMGYSRQPAQGARTANCDHRHRALLSRCRQNV